MGLRCLGVGLINRSCLAPRQPIHFQASKMTSFWAKEKKKLKPHPKRNVFGVLEEYGEEELDI